ncbi:hypothetical protein [Rhodococcus sp. H29-C3]|uniref:hypothetical protein n=1 Tax=Rhodococcus sp. H29-C3 TaxID=3046307 RepID=UPI0024BB3182|nr:hypothetical protein [Rhodococcus sp. H29-C3]MDJ0362477.1 hypothetical protein [Rhodococcus sp. H29-C3]
MLDLSHVPAAAVTAAAVLALAGCGGSSDPDPIPEGTDAHVQIDPLDPAGLDAPGAATTAMNAILSWQPAVDASKADALARARPWITTPLIDTLDAPRAPPSYVRTGSGTPGLARKTPSPPPAGPSRVPPPRPPE